MGKIGYARGLKLILSVGRNGVRGSGTWIINMVVAVETGVPRNYSEPMVSPFMQDFFDIKEP